jgi:hypothetical protein
MSPPLKIDAVTPSTPRSLRAFICQLNQGAVLIARKIMPKPKTGVKIPNQPKSLTSLMFKAGAA